MRHIAFSVIGTMVLLALPALLIAQSPAAPATQPTQADLEKRFEQEMTDVVMAGSYTATGHPSPGHDQYTIHKVSKEDGDYWTFFARVQFGDKDVDLPFRLQVKWAGDTPVIEVTDFGFPGLGTYTARVLIYKDQYAGTWSGHGHGGQLWGHIEHNPSTAPSTRPTAAK